MQKHLRGVNWHGFLFVGMRGVWHWRNGVMRDGRTDGRRLGNGDDYDELSGMDGDEGMGRHPEDIPVLTLIVASFSHYVAPRENMACNRCEEEYNCKKEN